MNRLLVTTALGLLLGAAPAFAETQAPLDNAANPPAMEAPQPSSDVPSIQSPADPSPSLQTPEQSSEAPQSIAPKEDLANKDAAPAPQFLKEQRSNEWLASTIIDKPVVNTANETIGDVNDLVTDDQGRIVAALIGVGGFLGIGEKNVAIPYEDLKLARDDNDNVTVIANLTKDQLAAAPDYDTVDEQEVTQSSAKTDLEEKTKTY